MGTVADKLNYLNDTKKEIKQAIESKDMPVPVGTSFRGYADKISNIYNDALFLKNTPSKLGTKVNRVAWDPYIIYGNGSYVFNDSNQSDYLVGNDELGWNYRKNSPILSDNPNTFRKLRFFKNKFFTIKSGILYTSETAEENTWTSLDLNKFTGISEKISGTIGSLEIKDYCVVYLNFTNHAPIAMYSYDFINWKVNNNVNYDLSLLSFYEPVYNNVGVYIFDSAKKNLVKTTDGFNFENVLDVSNTSSSSFENTIYKFGSGNTVGIFYPVNDKNMNIKFYISEDDFVTKKSGYLFDSRFSSQDFGIVSLNNTYYACANKNSTYRERHVYVIKYESLIAGKTNAIDSVYHTSDVTTGASINYANGRLIFITRLNNEATFWTLHFSYDGYYWTEKIINGLLDVNKTNVTSDILTKLNAMQTASLAQAYAEGVNDIVNAK